MVTYLTGKTHVIPKKLVGGFLIHTTTTHVLVHDVKLEAVGVRAG